MLLKLFFLHSICLQIKPNISEWPLQIKTHRTIIIVCTACEYSAGIIGYLKTIIIMKNALCFLFSFFFMFLHGICLQLRPNIVVHTSKQNVPHNYFLHCLGKFSWYYGRLSDVVTCICTLALQVGVAGKYTAKHWC